MEVIENCEVEGCSNFKYGHGFHPTLSGMPSLLSLKPKIVSFS